MNYTRISVIVPIYKVEKYLRRCIDSLLQQTMKEIEIILVDDGSPDECPVICDEYAKENDNIVVVHKENEGLGLARNSGLDVAKGDYVVFVDSDDYVTNDMCELLYKKACRYKADIVYANHFKDANGKISAPVESVSQDIIYSNQKEIEEFALNMIANDPAEVSDTPIEVSVWAAAFKRELIEKNRIRFVSERILISEDVVFNIEIYKAAKTIVICPEAVYYYCFNEGSLSKSYKKDRFYKDKQLWKYVGEKLGNGKMEREERFTRFIVARARCALCLIVASETVFGKKEAMECFNSIVYDQDLQNCLKTYPIQKSRKLQKLFLVCLKHRLRGLLYQLCKLNNLRKK